MSRYTLTQQHKTMCALMLLCIISFIIGMYIADITASPPVEREPTAYELIQEIHRQSGNSP